jgi:hypothetical protein
VSGLRASGLLAAALIAAVVLTAGDALAAADALAAGEVLPQVVAGAPVEVSVTVYRAPNRVAGSINLDALGGFAFISETRVLRLPAGRSRVRFEGVADGIEAASAIVTGLPAGVIEKNRDAALLGPQALVDAAVGKRVELLRSDPKTGRTVRTPVEIRSAADGLVFTGPDGIEALRCSGLAETFGFSSALGLSARPTLSVVVATREPVTAEVRLSYLSAAFDWAADYVAILAADETSIDLGAWLTLANGLSRGARANRCGSTQSSHGRRRADLAAEPDSRAVLAARFDQRLAAQRVLAAKEELGRGDARPRGSRRQRAGGTRGHAQRNSGLPGTAGRLETLPGPGANDRGEPASEAGPALRSRTRAGPAHLRD